MCKWIEKCSHVNVSCGQAQECSYSPAVLQVPKNPISDEQLKGFNEGTSCSLVRARDITREGNHELRLRAEFSKRQYSGSYILADDILNLRILLEAKSVEEFLKEVV